MYIISNDIYTTTGPVQTYEKLYPFAFKVNRWKA